VEIYTIGFTKKNAAEFFQTLRRAGIRRLIDVRLNNTSQLAAFAKRDDLQFFLRELCQADYRHEPTLAPTDDILDAYKKKQISWQEYETRYVDLLIDRAAHNAVDRRLFDVPAVLLCSEPSPERCHRRLAAEYLAAKWGDAKVIHL
jgi:uncharacterized protein (DUF488 family)